MKEKQPAKLSESCRLMQDSSKVELFRSGAANDEFDGIARYSDKSWPIYRQFGWQRGKGSRPIGDEGLFFYPFYKGDVIYETCI